VVTTSTDLQALVEEVGGESVRAESLTAPAQDPHTVEVRAGQLARLRAATLLVRIGLDHEPWLGPALKAIGDSRFVPGSAHYLDTSTSIALLQTETPRVRPERGAHVHGLGNPHYWLDPENARPMTAALLGALVRLAPEERGRFEGRRQRFLERLDDGLRRWQRATAPVRGMRVVVVHDTWPYFARRFGLSVVATVEPHPGVPPSPASLAALIERMRQASVPLLIAEPSSNSAVVRQVASRTGARAVTLLPSVGAEPEARDYLSLFDVNVARLVAAVTAGR
jgi:ABC-type Zn uptake system ZnuABC Zn-binding protein ZnuA